MLVSLTCLWLLAFFQIISESGTFSVKPVYLCCSIGVMESCFNTRLWGWGYYSWTVFLRAGEKGKSSFLGSEAVWVLSNIVILPVTGRLALQIFVAFECDLCFPHCEQLLKHILKILGVMSFFMPYIEVYFCSDSVLLSLRGNQQLLLRS